MKIGSYVCSPIYNGDNLEEIKKSFPFYITRDDQDNKDSNSLYSIERANGKACICSGQDRVSKAVHFFTNIGVLNLEVGEQLCFFEIE